MLPALGGLPLVLDWLVVTVPFITIYWLTQRQFFQSSHDECRHVYISGITGCGKTFFLLWQIIRRLILQPENGQIAIFVKDGTQILDYIPEQTVKRGVILMAPYSKRPRGINLLKLYTTDPQEREIVAAQVVDLFKMIYSQTFKDNMEELLYCSVQAILEYSIRRNKPVTLWDVYQFLQDDHFQGDVLRVVRKRTVKDAFAEPESKSVLATLRRLRKPMSSDMLLASLCHDDIDMREVMDKGQFLICDFDYGQCRSQMIPNFLASVIFTKIELLAHERNSRDKALYVYCDEFQNYVGPSFPQAIFMLRSKRVALTLAHQSGEAQLSNHQEAAVLACGSLYFFQQHPGDVSMAKKAIDDEAYKDYKFTRQPVRTYVARLSMNGGTRIVKGRTPDMFPKVGLADKVWKSNSQGPTLAQIVARVQKANERDVDPVQGDVIDVEGYVVDDDMDEEAGVPCLPTGINR